MREAQPTPLSMEGNTGSSSLEREHMGAKVGLCSGQGVAAGAQDTEDPNVTASLRLSSDTCFRSDCELGLLEGATEVI